jgi:hypothetical protein
LREEKRLEHSERSIEPRNEPSPLLRLFAIAAVRIEGDFEFDEVREQIIHSPQWIAEAKNQEDRHERYVLMTAFILDVLFNKVEELRGEDANGKLVKAYDDLENSMNSCDVVNLKVVLNEEGNDHHFTISTYASKKKDKDKKEDGSKVFDMSKSDFDVDCTEMLYNDGINTAKENGYRRINCTARTNYRLAMKLAVSSGFFNPDKPFHIGQEKSYDPSHVERAMGHGNQH